MISPEYLKELTRAAWHVKPFIDRSHYTKTPSDVVMDAVHLEKLHEAADLLYRLALHINAMCEARDKAAPDEWFASHGEDGLCRIDDGKMHGMFGFECEWHEGRFITTAANATQSIIEILKEKE